MNWDDPDAPPPPATLNEDLRGLLHGCLAVVAVACVLLAAALWLAGAM